MSATYFGILTKYGEEREAQAHALGVPLKITSLAVGDGGGIVPTPDRLQTAVIGEWRRKPLNQLSTDPANPSWLIAEQVIPENEGGNWIRTLGLHDETGGLVAVANCPPTYKPLLAEGSGRTQVIRMVLMVSSAANFELKIDPAVVLSTRKYVDDGLALKLDKTGTAIAAAKFATPRTIALTGDGTASVSFDGSKNVSAGLTLAASGVTAGTAGGANEIPVLTVDAKGRVTKLDNVAVGNAATATKLAATRLFSIAGGATAGGASFDGSGNVVLNVTALDVSKVNAGILPVARGGTGLATVAAGSFLSGAGSNAMIPRTPAQVLEDIQALPKAGGDISGPVVLAIGATIGTQYGVNASLGRTAHVLLPDGGGFSTNTGTVVGAIKITLPPAAVGANTMIRLRVDVFEYLEGVPPVSLLIHGYVQTTKAWGRCGATVVAGSAVSDLPVRFGADATGSLCIWLGDTTKSWSYPSVTVAEVLAKYNAAGATVAAWGVGWKVEPVTAFETVSQTLAGGNLAFGRSDITNVSGLQEALGLKANAAVTMTAGNGLSGGGNLGANRSFALGTPGTINKTSTNAVQATSHTHALDISASDIGAASTDITLTAGNGLSGGGNLGANRSFALGTPGTINKTSTNAVQATSHTHALDISASEIGAASADLTLTAGNGLSGGGSLGANRTFSLGTPGKLTAASANAVTATSHTHELDTQISPMDVTAGRLLTVGAFGLGASNLLDTADLNTVVIPALYGQSQNVNATRARNYPVTSAGTLLVESGGGQITTQKYTVYNTGETFSRGCYSNVWSEWIKHASTAFVAGGQCRLTVASATSLVLSPYGGRALVIDGALQLIPSAGVSISNAGLAASRLYYVYAYMNGSNMALELSTTGHSANDSGVEIKTGDATRSLVGMIYTSAASQFVDSAADRLCLNWFNRRSISAGQVLNSFTTFTNTTLNEINGTLRARFLAWKDEAVFAAADGYGSNNTAGSSVQLQAAIDSNIFGVALLFNSATAGASCAFSSSGVGMLNEGLHTAQLFGFVGGGQGNIGIGCYVKILTRG